MRLNDLVSDPWFFLIGAFIFGVVITLIAGVLSWLLRIVYGLMVWTAQGIRFRRDERKALHQMRLNRDQISTWQRWHRGRMDWWRHVTGLVVVLGVVGSLCAAEPSPWRDVTTTAKATEIQGCIYLKRVKSSGAYVTDTPSATNHATALALKRLMILTDRAGGDVVLVTEIEADGGRAAMVGEAYRCAAR